MKRKNYSLEQSETVHSYRGVTVGGGRGGNGPPTFWQNRRRRRQRRRAAIAAALLLAPPVLESHLRPGPVNKIGSGYVTSAYFWDMPYGHFWFTGPVRTNCGRLKLLIHKK